MHARRTAAMAALAAAVALLHGALVQALWGPASPPVRGVSSLQLRSVTPVAAAVAPVAAVPVPPASRQPARRAAPTVERPAEAAPAQPDATVPPYATRLPPAVQWRYALRRGTLTGEAALRWQPDGDRYHAELEGHVDGRQVIGWTSTGGFDDAGVAPERLVVRRGRQAHAANFQREAGKITYSGPAVEHPLPAGAQDRLSWLLQLPGIVAASPERFAAAGTRIDLFVSGARGDADRWTFTVAGIDEVAWPDGTSAPALKLVREPLRPYDLRIEVWLDPAQHHLPLRLRWSLEGRDDATELLREREAHPR